MTGVDPKGLAEATEAVQAWLDWCDRNGEAPDARSGATVAIEAHLAALIPLKGAPVAWQAKAKNPGENFARDWFQIEQEYFGANPEHFEYRPLFASQPLRKNAEEADKPAPSTLPATKGVTEAMAERFSAGVAKYWEGRRSGRDGDAIMAGLAAALSLPAPGGGERPTWREFDHTTIDYVLRYGGRCRECADHLGLCPHGLPCDVDDAKTAIRWVLKALNYGITNGFLPNPALSPAPDDQPEPDEMQPDRYTGGDFNGVVRGKRP